METSRRSFLKGAIGGAAAAAAATVSVPAVAAGLPKKWDYTGDVVVVGFGGAGATTAISAAQHGAKVVVLEKNPENHHLSNTRMSGGIFHCPFKDGDPKALQDYAQAMFSGENIPWKEEGEIPEYSVPLAKLWAEYTPKNLDFMQSLDPAFIGGTQPGFNKASFGNFPGAKECKYNAYRATYLKRMKSFNDISFGRPKEETSSGEAFWQCLATGVAKQGKKVQVLWESPAFQLVKNPKGEVVGVLAKRAGKTIAVRAKKAVVLCSGGYEYNKAMREAFLEGPGVSGWAFYGTTSNTGDGIAMAMAAGSGLQKAGKSAARLIVPTLDKCNGMRIGSITPSVGSPHSIVVDNMGNRYEAETKITDNPSRYFFYKAAVQFDITKLSYPRTPSWMILDDQLFKSKPLVALGISTVGFGITKWSKDNMSALDSGLILKADTIEELGEKIKKAEMNKNRMVPANLVKTVEKFNKFCDEKKDEDFGRRPVTLAKIEKGPFYAMPLVAGGPNTKGGPLFDGRHRVLTWDGKPIPGLYLVGEISSVLKFVYQGGGNLTECLVYGQSVGKEVAGLPDRAA
ncbi:MAG: FAD-dependent oxidoreductase [Sutterellaceae bacterium]|nr:FAD-dependent oxidoreductase [Sutterellaceae bacterium]MDD7442312.1 FAD-dependent oxidoreductase [Sutterellaceae bacterium]MDY2868364.1 FAD-dependent oxidoreductase [Mesosutterella sp.]